MFLQLFRAWLLMMLFSLAALTLLLALTYYRHHGTLLYLWLR